MQYVSECAFKVVKIYPNVNHINLHVGQKVNGGRETMSSRTSRGADIHFWTI